MNKKPLFMPALHELARCYQAFERYSSAHIRTLGLTAPQFDVITTLGNTSGMAPKALSERTLITKGTLTGVLDRLEVKRMIRRTRSKLDGRSQVVELTPKGKTAFIKVFPAHLKHLARAFAAFKPRDYQRLEASLRDLRGALEPVEEG